MIFQEPMTALNALYTVGDQIAEVLELHRRCRRATRTKRPFSSLQTPAFPSQRGGRGRFRISCRADSASAP